MIIKYAIGIIGATGLMILWVIIQHLWRNTFMDQQKNLDVLAGRSDCGSCGCRTPCDNKKNKVKNKQ